MDNFPPPPYLASNPIIGLKKKKKGKQANLLQC